MDVQYRHDPAQIDLTNTDQDQLADLALEDRICPGCKRSAVSENGGMVVAFGQSFFHVPCFRCAKCGDRVTADTNLLLLSDGSPICANCSYSCSVCREPILDEAIMTGDDSYHAHCFKCKVCHNRIDELVFAKTSQGIYCMECHNERMIKIRKYNERKAERERHLREQTSQQFSPPATRPKLPSRPSTGGASSHSPSPIAQAGSQAPSSPANAHIPVVVAPPRTPQKPYPPIPFKPSSNSSLNSNSPQTPGKTNGGPLSHLTAPRTPSSTLQASPTPREQKRRSINPGLTLSNPLAGNVAVAPQSTFSPTLSPMSAQFPGRSSSPNGRTSLSSRGSAGSFYHSPVSSTAEDDTITRPLPSPSGSRISRSSPQQKSFPQDSDRPASRAAVPHSVESASESEPEIDVSSAYGLESESLPPPLPSKSNDHSPPLEDSEVGAQELTIRHDSMSEESESSPVETTSHATFIAPALPPIRFSLTTADFADLFNSVDAPPGSKGSQHGHAHDLQHTNGRDATFTPQTPPPTAVDSGRTGLMAGDDAESRRLRALRARPDFERNDSSSSQPAQSPEVTLTAPDSHVSNTLQQPVEVVIQRLQEALLDSKDRGSQQLRLDRSFVEAIAHALNARNDEYESMKKSLDGIRRQSKQAMDGLTVAQVEYDRELKGRRDAEAEVTRLRVLLSGQTARLTVLSGDTRRQELRQQMSKELHENLSGLEHDLSKLKVQRDMTLAEVEELSAVGSNSATNPDPPAQLGRSMTMRLDKLKTQYQRDLLPLTEEREALSREIAELRGTRELYLEETTVLNARNEELAQLSAQYARRIDSAPQDQQSTLETPSKPNSVHRPSVERAAAQAQVLQHLQTDVESVDGRSIRPVKVEMEQPTPSKGGKFMKWGGSSRPRDVTASSSGRPGTGNREHNFMQTSVLRLTRCDHCGDKMWGSQLRCTGCNISVHTRCIHGVSPTCSSQHRNNQDDGNPMPPSMFGRDLVEQVLSDARGGPRQVPVIVEKCVEAVEVIALEYEGIYRKTGGSGQSKTITQLFERGDYDAFDLCDTDRFNDICSVTSVLKTYFRTLPVPLLTYDLHDSFMAAAETKDVETKNRMLTELVASLPSEHYYTLRVLMLHLHRVCERAEVNLMNARNLGVVFGPTLMRSRNPGAEFSDMAGKAMSVEWLVENALSVFSMR